MQRTGRLRLSEVNQHLVCVLCGGYFIDATTIVECLHSFCRSCLIKYLECNSFCPICDVQIHKAKPFLNIKPDKALQDIVYKLVPGLFHSEMRRRREFYAKHPDRVHETTPEGRGVGLERLIYSPDDSISLSLEYLEGEDEDITCSSSRSSGSDMSASEESPSRRYLRCPALVTIAHLKKFLTLKYELPPDYTVDVIHRRESLPDDYTLMDVAYIYTWKQNGPMRFFYRIYKSKPGIASAPVKQTHLASSTSDSRETTATSCIAQELPNSRPVPTNSETVEQRCTTSLLEPVTADDDVSASNESTKEAASAESTSQFSEKKPVEEHKPAVANNKVSETHTTDPCDKKLNRIFPAGKSPHPVVPTAQSGSSEDRISTHSPDTVAVASEHKLPTISTNEVLEDSNSTVSKVSVASELDQKPSDVDSKSSSQQPSSDSKLLVKSEKVSSLNGSSTLTKCDQHLNGKVPETKRKIQSSSLPNASESNKVTSEKVKTSECTAVTSVVKNNNNNNKSCDELSVKVEKEQVAADSVNIVNKSKPTSEKISQYHSQSSVKKLSHLVKLVPETNKVAKSQLQAGREASKLGRASQKISIRHDTSEQPPPKKEKLEVGEKKDVVKKEVPNSASLENVSAGKLSMSTNITTLTANNINNKVPQQNNQVIKNNQQILRKNDEIMRCPSTIKRPPQIVQRKQQDMKACTVQIRALGDKSSAKKRKPASLNPNNNPQNNTLVNAKHEDNQPLPKKSRTHAENNHLIEQKPGDWKNQSAPNSIAPQKLQNTTEKTCLKTETSTNNVNNSKNHFQLPTPKAVAADQRINNTLNKKESNNKHIVRGDKVLTFVSVQRPLHSSQNNVSSKHFNNVQPITIKSEPSVQKPDATTPHVPVPACPKPEKTSLSSTPVAAHSNNNSRVHVPAVKKASSEAQSNSGVLDLSASPRRPQQHSILSIAQTLARRQQQQQLQQQQQCSSPAPPLSPLSSLSPFPVMSVPVRSPPPQLRIPMPPQHRSGHPPQQQQQQRPSSLSSSSPSPPADMLPGCSRAGLEAHPSHMMSPAAVMYRQQLEMQRFWKQNPSAGMDWFSDANALKKFENFMKTLQHQQGSRNSAFYPFHNNATAQHHRK